MDARDVVFCEYRFIVDNHHDHHCCFLANPQSGWSLIDSIRPLGQFCIGFEFGNVATESSAFGLKLDGESEVLRFLKRTITSQVIHFQSHSYLLAYLIDCLELNHI